MNIQVILSRLDELFQEKDIDGVEVFLSNSLEQAIKEGDTSSIITIINELIGFYRDTSQYTRALLYCDKILNLMKQLGLTKHISYATTMLNVANAYRAAGNYEESLEFYQKVLPIYHELLEVDDLLIASYYNNLSLLNQEMEAYEEACKNLYKALAIVETHKDEQIKVATTHGNLAVTLLKLGKVKEAQEHARCSLDLFEEQEEVDFHYSISLSAMGDVCFYQENYREAITYYEKALIELESNVGRSEGYLRILENLQVTLEKLGEPEALKGISLARKYYETYGRAMIEEKFKDYQGRIAVGYVGEGSDCFGFDDKQSVDHDFGPGFCMWLTDEDYEQIGEALQSEYDKLPEHLYGITRNKTTYGKKRVGVLRISSFYMDITGYNQGPSTMQEWLTIEEWKLATSANGQVFTDPLGEFTKIRQNIKAYYCEEVYVRRLAQNLGRMSQTGQYNVKRMLNRNDILSANFLVHQFIQATVHTLYLLERVYAPHEKWLFEGLKRIKGKAYIQEILIHIEGLIQESLCKGSILEALLQINKKVASICGIIVKELKEKGLSQIHSNYLEDQANYIISHTTKELVNKIVNLEWESFDKVKNVGQRASCQDDFSTFEIMRKSQYLAWNKPLLLSYLSDLEEAKKVKRNLITEKYARMMKSTSPEEYRKIENQLIPATEQKQAIIDQIVAIQVAQMVEFKQEYPKMAGNARIIHASEDTLYDTSYETYLRGELTTYSDSTLLLYGRFLAEVIQNGGNIAKRIMTNTAILYGYKSLEDAERRISI